MKKNLKKWALLLIMAITLPVTTMAQDKVEASVGADLVSGCQAPLSVGIPRQKYWRGLAFPSPRADLPHCRWTGPLKKL